MKLLRMLLAVIIMLASALSGAEAVPEKSAQPPLVVGISAVLIDSATGQVLYTKNEHARMYPASTTKILTALVALEQGKLSDVVRIDKAATKAEGSSIWLQEGEELTLEELIWALMLNSANDAAVAIANHISGSEEGFAKLMNAKARDLGAKESNFINPNGLPDNNHYVTAYDLALISKAAMANPKFREIAGSKVKEINRTPADALTRLINHNKLLWRLEGANGVKTGYTLQAQQCLVASAKRGDQEFIAIVLSSVGKNIWEDVTKLLEYGFANYKTVQLVEANRFVKAIPVENAETPVQAVTARSLAHTVSRGGTIKPQFRIEMGNQLKAPIVKGTVIGKMVYSMEGRDVGQVELLAANNVEAKRFPIYTALLAGGGVLGIILLLLLVRKAARRRQRRRLRRARLYGASVK